MRRSLSRVYSKWSVCSRCAGFAFFLLLNFYAMPLVEREFRSCRPPSSVSPSILDSPTLARVERARRRHENEERASPLRDTLSSYCPSLMSVEPGREMHAIKKGLLWQQRERLFARWKERYFILTRDYLHCFKRSSGNEKISNMGQFIFKVKLVEVEKVEWINKKSYSTVALALQDRDYRILLRTNDGLEDWFELLEECMMTSKERRKALRKFGAPTSWSPTLGLDNTSGEKSNKSGNKNNVDSWLLSRTNPATIRIEGPGISDSVPDLQNPQHQQHLRSQSNREDRFWPKNFPAPYSQRLSLLTDIDLNNCENSIGTPSVRSSTRANSYQLNKDVFFISSEEKYYNNSEYRCERAAVSPLASFRNAGLFTPPRRIPQENCFANSASPLQVKYRDRSQSDAFNCRTRYSSSSAANRRSYISQQTTNV